ncbi:NAD-dependent epimerase/dehydratase family protein [Nocardia cyriacigeorgica]|uniref:NAD-dependent epimerase/dehydratase family protein n=1 Tax=Nocardia cyriacigeorgica TaxID=135487 RepID=UPI002457E854|nr:NAD-dependent epimerase/dehydratase family protein [Nocardia cyriacigeorgica]
MKILIVGGTGMIGAHTALHLREQGNDVTVAARRPLDERDEQHPLLPDEFIVQGRGNVISYRPNPAETALLGYGLDDCRRAVGEMYETVRAEPVE